MTDERQSAPHAHGDSLGGLRAATEARAQRTGRLFVSRASHELRQPLAALKLLTAELPHIQDPVMQRDVIAAITASATMMEEFVTAMIDFNKLEADAMEFAMQVFDPGPPVLAAMEDQKTAALSGGIALRQSGSFRPIFGDPFLFRRLIDCLLSNAVRFGAGGKILIGARNWEKVQRIEVWDQGLGIPEAELDAVFEPYYQVDREKAVAGGGLGLGLPIARLIAENMAGSLTLRSVPGRGTVAVLELPLIQQSDAAG